MHADSVAIWDLLDLVEANPEHFKYESKPRLSELVEKARKDLDELTEPIEKLRVLRNKTLAHLDPDTITDLQKLKQETRVTLGELEKIYEVLGNILACIGQAYDGAVRITQLSNWGDFRHLLQLSEMGRKASLVEVEYSE